jgi:hypothetical protein
VEQACNVGLRVFILWAPEEGVERADLDTDSAVHAERVIDIKTVKKVYCSRSPTLTASGSLLFVALDIDAPIRAGSTTEHARGAVVFMQSNDSTRARRWLLLLVGVLHSDSAFEHRLKGDPKTTYETREFEGH